MSTKYPSPLLGYNNNVRHKGRVFHIQTEDSGAKYGHIITHLFMDGGRILKSVKTSYSEYIGSERMSEIVREMMKQQHKAMFIALRDGKFDPLADGGTGSSPGVPGTSPEQLPADAPPAKASPIADAIAEVIGPATRARAPSSPLVPVEAADRSSILAAQGLAAATTEDHDDEAPETLRHSRDDIKLDVGAIERAAAAAVPAVPILRDASDLPPPPANLFREKNTGRYRVTPHPPGIEVPESPEEVAPTAATAASRSSSSHAAVKGSGERRYAPTRPASIFGQARPTQGKSIFGGDLISDKSLDEVILSYLAEDLDEKK
jgi:hypothetical protein